jgi:5-methylcytosine-specific restriction endonuclease McrA
MFDCRNEDRQGQGPLRRSQLRRALPETMSREERLAAARWRELVLASGFCAVCGSARHLEGHHVIPQRFLRSLERRLGLGAGTLLWDPTLGMALCRRCHERHELAVERVARSALPARTCERAHELGFDLLIERMYPG